MFFKNFLFYSQPDQLLTEDAHFLNLQKKGL